MQVDVVPTSSPLGATTFSMQLQTVTALLNKMVYALYPQQAALYKQLYLVHQEATRAVRLTISFTNTFAHLVKAQIIL